MPHTKQIKSTPQAVIFDVFGTMCVARKLCHPYRHIYERLPEVHGDIEKARNITKVRNISLGAFARELGIAEHTITDMEAALANELASIELFPETKHVLQRLRQKGVKLALASNLTTPHKRAVLKLLPVQFDVYAWSFELGTVKPMRKIYEYVLRQLSMSAAQVIMAGDSLEKDCEAPKALGMQGYHISREHSRDLESFYKEFFR